MGGAVPAYDRLGNLTRVEAKFGGVSTYESLYAYDASNRIDAWTWNGTPLDFDFDARGNLIDHGGKAQTFVPPQKPSG